MPAPDILAGNTAIAAELRKLFEGWTAYTPVLTASTTSPTLGTGSTQLGAWNRQGDTIDWWAYIQFGTSGTAAGTGTYRVSLPPAAAYSTNRDFLFVGDAELNNSGTGYMRHLNLAGSTTTTEMWSGADPAASVAAAVPFAWSTSDFMYLKGRYRSST